MKFQDKINIKYLDLKRRAKMYEQLEVGKIKFEVVPIYLNNVCIHTLFKLKYNPLETTKSSDTKKTSIIIKLLCIFVTSSLLWSSLNYFLASIGILTHGNDLIVSTITPYIFSSTSSNLVPHLSVLISKLTIF